MAIADIHRPFHGLIDVGDHDFRRLSRACGLAKGWFRLPFGSGEVRQVHLARFLVAQETGGGEKLVVEEARER